MKILNTIKKLTDSIILKLCPILYMGLTRAQDSHDRFLFGSKIIKSKSKSKNISVIDVGCGSGNFFIYLKSIFPECKYLGVDFDIKKINSKKYNNNNFKIVEKDLRKELSLGKFDFVWSSEVIEHIIDDRFFFRNLVNSVKDDGYIILTSPSLMGIKYFYNRFKWSLQVSKKEDGGHVKLGYDENELKTLAERNSLELLDIYYISECNDFRAKNIGKINNGLYCYFFNILYFLKIFSFKRFENKNNISFALKYLSIGAVFKKKIN